MYHRMFKLTVLLHAVCDTVPVLEIWSSETDENVSIKYKLLSKFNSGLTFVQCSAVLSLPFWPYHWSSCWPVFVVNICHMIMFLSHGCHCILYVSVKWTSTLHWLFWKIKAV